MNHLHKHSEHKIVSFFFSTPIDLHEYSPSQVPPGAITNREGNRSFLIQTLQLPKYSDNSLPTGCPKKINTFQTDNWEMRCLESISFYLCFVSWAANLWGIIWNAILSQLHKYTIIWQEKNVKIQSPVYNIDYKTKIFQILARNGRILITNL